MRRLGWATAFVLSVCLATAAHAAVDRSPTWASLTPAQQQALSPLQRDWSSIDANRKQKWIELAAKFPAMPMDERSRVQARMAEWARLTPAERAGARLQFQEARRLPAEERQARWQAYQALSPEERRRLAQQVKPALKAASGVEPAGKPRPAGEAANAARAASAAVGRAGVVAPPTAATASNRVVAPTVVQARPGATTTSMSKPTAPPTHLQPGSSKIAATPGYIDSTTLLPRRGPQGAAVRSAASTDPKHQP